MRKTTKRIYEFGTFRLDTEERLLLSNGETVPLTPKVFDTLVVLVQKSGHVVGKDELMSEVWADSFVEESNLTQNTSVLRKVLGEERGGRLYIETVSKRGYRFVASVREVRSDNYPAIETEMHSGPRILSRETAEHDVLNSIAVLPLVNGSLSPDAEYLSDGITESIINSLSSCPNCESWRAARSFATRAKRLNRKRSGRLWACEQCLWEEFYRSPIV